MTYSVAVVRARWCCSRGLGLAMLHLLVTLFGPRRADPGPAGLPPLQPVPDQCDELVVRGHQPRAGPARRRAWLWRLTSGYLRDRRRSDLVASVAVGGLRAGLRRAHALRLPAHAGDHRAATSPPAGSASGSASSGTTTGRPSSPMSSCGLGLHRASTCRRPGDPCQSTDGDRLEPVHRQRRPQHRPAGGRRRARPAGTSRGRLSSRWRRPGWCASSPTSSSPPCSRSSAMTRDRAMRAWLIPLLQLALSTVLVAQGPGAVRSGHRTRRAVLRPDGARHRAGAGPGLPAASRAPASRSTVRGRALAGRPSGCRRGGDARVRAVLARPAPPPSRCGTSPAKNPEFWYAAFEKSLAAHDPPVDLVAATVPPFVLTLPASAYEQSLAQYSATRCGSRRSSRTTSTSSTTTDSSSAPTWTVARSAVAPAPADCGYPIGTERDGPPRRPRARLRLAGPGRRTQRDARHHGDDLDRQMVDTRVDTSSAGRRTCSRCPGDAEYEARAVQRRRPGQRAVRLFAGGGLDPGPGPASGLSALGRRA